MDSQSNKLWYDHDHDAWLEFNRMKRSGKYTVLELWREGNPEKSSAELRQGKLLCAWDYESGDLNPQASLDWTKLKHYIVTVSD